MNDEAFLLLRVIAFVTPAIALLMTLINPLRQERRHDDDIPLFRWLLVSFAFLILAGIANVCFIIFPNYPPLIVVKLLFLFGMLVLLYPTIRLMFRKMT